MRSSTFEKDRFKESTYERVGPTKRIKISVSLKSDFYLAEKGRRVATEHWCQKQWTRYWENHFHFCGFNQAVSCGVENLGYLINWGDWENWVTNKFMQIFLRNIFYGTNGFYLFKQG